MIDSDFRDLRASLPPFTYFQDDLGIIYYSHGVALRGEELATCVYVPALFTEDPQVVEWSTGRQYTKVICGGLRYERIELEDSPNDELKEVISRRLKVTLEGDRFFLSVPHLSIRTVFSPWEATTAIIEGKGIGRLVPSATRRSVELAVRTFSDVGIPRRCIGLYGGLQCGLGRVDRFIHDVDLVVAGQVYYLNILARCSGNKSRWIPDRVARHDFLRLNALRRAELSQVYVPFDGAELMIDVRTSPIAGEHSGAACAAKRSRGSVVVQFEGIVVDASASLSLPACYVVKSRLSGDLIHVVSVNHHMVGSAGVGETVFVTGMAGQPGWVHLLSESEHSMRVM